MLGWMNHKLESRLPGDKDLNVGPETIKLLEENIGRALDDIKQSKILYDSPPRVMGIKKLTSGS